MNHKGLITCLQSNAEPLDIRRCNKFLIPEKLFQYRTFSEPHSEPPIVQWLSELVFCEHIAISGYYPNNSLGSWLVLSCLLRCCVQDSMYVVPQPALWLSRTILSLLNPHLALRIKFSFFSSSATFYMCSIRDQGRNMKTSTLADSDWVIWKNVMVICGMC